MQVMILLLTLAHAEYYGKYGSQDDLYNFYKNADTEDTPATTGVSLSDEEGYTQTMQRLARVSADSLRKLDKKELNDFKEALTMLMRSTEGDEVYSIRTEFNVVTRTANTHVLTPGPTAINNILMDILDKLETRTEAFSQTKPTHSRTTLKATRVASNYSNVSPTLHAPLTNTARRWFSINLNVQSEETTEPYAATDTTAPIDATDSTAPIDATDSTAPIDSTDETDTVLAQTAGTFEKIDPVTTDSILNETVFETDIFSTDNDTVLGTTEYTTDEVEPINATLPEITVAMTGSDEVELSDKMKDYANSSTALTSANRRAGGFATTKYSNITADHMYRRAQKTTTKFRVRKTRTKTKKRKTPKYTYSTTTTKSRRRKTKRRSTTTTTTTTTTAFPLDVPRLIELITNLTMDYGPNITSIVNKTLQELPILTCPTVTTTEEPTTTAMTTTPDPYGNLTGTIMGKCFVCGLETPAMPRHARCADAFAGDFIPLVPVDATARKMLASYRKYCRWMNVPKYVINETDPRSMWGRWTGGCSVRWIDISGIYTQRTCRNRHRAVMGKHWVSKRMAKLEMALQRLDSGCIISPMASLVPLSRGVSLYARFHACVCMGSWCNRAPPSAQCMLHTVVLSLMLVFIFRYAENAFYFVSFIT